MSGSTRPGAVPAPPGSVDSAVPWHYGDPHAEQRTLLAGQGAVDLSHRGVIKVSGVDRLSWLHDLTTQHLLAIGPGQSTLALILDPNGRVEHELHLIDDATSVWITTEPNRVAELAAYLNSMKFMLRVEVADVTPDYAVVWVPKREPDETRPTWLISPDYAGIGVTDAGTDRGGDASGYVPARPAALLGAEVIVPRSDLESYLGAQGQPAGTWALEALRVAAAVPRLGFETDHKTLPHEVGWIGPAVHLNKGCYRGQETVARVHNMGRPPRRLVLLHLDGSQEAMPTHGDDVLLVERVVGFVGSVARHYELGPIATAVVKRSVPTDATLTVHSAADNLRIDAWQEPVVASQ